MIKSRGLGGAGLWLRKLARLAEAYTVSALEPGEPTVTERWSLLVLILRYLLPKEARLRLDCLTVDGRCISLRKQPLRGRGLKRRIGLQALLLTRCLRRSNLLVKVAIPSTQNLADSSLTDGLAIRLLKSLAGGLL
jgi:hypothetical protein